MAQSSESIETQPPPEVRLDKDKLQPDLRPSHPEQQPKPKPEPQHLPPAVLNGERLSPSITVASNVQPCESSANPTHSNGSVNGKEDSKDYRSKDHGEGNGRGDNSETTTAGELTEGTEGGAGTGAGAGAGAGVGTGSVKSRIETRGSTSSAPALSFDAAQVSTTQPQNDHNGDTEHGEKNRTRNSGSAPLSPSPPMSGLGGRPAPDGLHRQQNMLYQPSPSMHSAAHYTYPAQVQQQQPQQHDPYRTGPAPMNSSMALPSMRTFDHQQQQQLHQQSPAPQPQPPHGYAMGQPMAQQISGPIGAQMGLPGQAGMPPGPPVGMPYYTNTLPPSPYGMQVDPNGMRYAILPEIDPRIILANRQKKEIKRRTKTGCLTCRKRRIKCDEAHPTCNNCKKSKRECLGYDPIFRQPAAQAQAQAPAPVRIQPAPSPTNNNISPPSGTSSLVSPPTATAVSPIPLHVPVAPSTYPPPPEALSALPASAARSEARYDHTGSIDPVLRGFGPTTRGYDSAPRAPDTAPRPADTALHGVNPQVRTLEPPFRAEEQQAVRSRSSDPSSTTLAQSSPEAERTDNGNSQQQQQQHPSIPRAKKMKIDELIALGGAAPHALSSSPNEQTVDEIVRLYYEVYVPGLDLFFETQWYDLKNDSQAGVKNPLSILRLNKRVLDTFAAFLRAISDVKTTDPADMVYSGHLETCVVWELARLPYVAAYGTPTRPASISLPPEDDPTEIRCRLQVFETLLAGDTLSTNPLFPPPPPAAVNHANQVRVNELEFWYRLAEYLLQANSSSSPAHVSAREQCLSRMRNVLDGRENRDVIYSITVLREYTTQFDATHTEQTAPAHLDESDPRSKLAVATRFIQDEAAKTGTTNVVRRFADLAYRAYIRPGGNVRRA